MLSDNAAYKFDTPFKEPFVITHFWTNGTVTLHYGPTKIRHNILHIKPYKSDTNVEDINPKSIYDDVNI